MTFEIETEAPKILRALANGMHVDTHSLCICGSGQRFSDCCETKDGKQLAFTKGAFQAVLAYRASQGGIVQRIPRGLLKQLEQASRQRLPCLYPGCPQKPVYCHLIPENILRSRFGGHCLEYMYRDGSPQWSFDRVGVGQAGALHVFCSKHDNDLFASVDDLDINPGCWEQLFLLAFKSIAFSLRNVQQLLGFDFQVELFKPWLLDHRDELQTKKHFQFDISHSYEQYRRFTIAHGAFMHAVDALEQQQWDHFSYGYRAIDYGSDIFVAGFLNPSHDLDGRRINSRRTPIHLTCNTWSHDPALHVLFASPEGPSKASYAPLIEQLMNADKPLFVNAVNTILTAGQPKVLLPLDFEITDEDVGRIKSLRQKARTCMVASSKEVLDLRETGSNVSFIRA